MTNRNEGPTDSIFKPVDVPLYSARKCAKCKSATDWTVGQIPLCTNCIVEECRVKRAAEEAQ